MAAEYASYSEFVQEERRKASDEIATAAEPAARNHER